MDKNELYKMFKWLNKDISLDIVDEDMDIEAGIHPLERPIELYLSYGVINLDKPRGPTSHQVATWVRRILGVSKAGHGGTLDPGVSGVLPVGVDRATPAMRYIVGSKKEYIGIIRLHGNVKDDQLYNVLKLFEKGRVYQKPPFRSSVRRKLRTREIYKLEILERNGRDILFRIECESGFYVRKLAHDIGLILGVGAHLDELRRTAAGPFREEYNLVSLYDLAAAKYLLDRGDESLARKVIMPFEYIFKDMPKIILKDSAVASITYGAQLKRPGIFAVSGDFRRNEVVALFTKRSELVAVVKALYSRDDMLNLEKGQVAETLRVFMERDLYPKMWVKR